MAFKYQTEETALEQYSMHDAGEHWVCQYLDSLDIEWVETGFDGRDLAEGDGIVGGKPEQYDDEPDIYLPNYNTYIDIKTTQYDKYLGNCEQSCWEHYNQMSEQVIVACFVVTKGENQVTNTGCYVMDDTDKDGENKNPYGETYVEPEQVHPVEHIQTTLYNKR